MGDAKLWILMSIIIIAIITVLIAIFMFRNRKNLKKNKPDYYTFFILGIVWTFVGLIPNNHVFFIMGLAFMAIGLAHKDEWEKNRKSFKHLPKKQQMIIKILLWAGVVFIVLAVLLTFLLKRGYLA
jgi:hypothetical protein